MAEFTLNAPFRSFHGRMGNMVFVYRYGKQYARAYVRPANPDTPAQRERRSAFREAVRAWQALSEGEKGEWRQRARRTRRSGYSTFMAHRLKGSTTDAWREMAAAAVHAALRQERCGRAAGLPGLSPSALHCPPVTAPFIGGPVHNREEFRRREWANQLC